MFILFDDTKASDCHCSGVFINPRMLRIDKMHLLIFNRIVSGYTGIIKSVYIFSSWIMKSSHNSQVIRHI